MEKGILTLANRIGDFLSVSQDGYAIFSADDKLIGCNQAYADFMCMDLKSIVEQSFSQLLLTAHEKQQGPYIETQDIDLWLAKAQSKRRSQEFRLFEVDHTDGSWYLISEQTLPSGELLLHAKSISAQKSIEQKLSAHIHKLTDLALTDELTQIANRRSFIANVKSEISLYKRNHHAFTFCILDIDYFKKVNDQFGHQVGDKVLSQLCKLVSNTLREYDLFGRIGGEEFGILLRDTKTTEAYDIMDRLRKKVMNSTFNTATTPVKITLSIGLVESWLGCTFERLYNQSDMGLYRGKNNGRNQVVVINKVQES
ncbi:sensor domain-containing diguanylate cyclase [Paraglaciecola arctica]|uniref:sensor domain-containing diguanylate cyclase n=1 Tax=Paraglaciecola arctica TaxID=1128911 RepID=UPI001C072323|nr:sensor domain-containing diguanylate cyclase [Paraglaciecola arctica]MBU3005757.1 diguanylate cyclase [Paraglaciecola arctica]